MKVILTIPVSAADAPELDFLLEHLGDLPGSDDIDLVDNPPRVLLTTTQAWRETHSADLLHIAQDPRAGGRPWVWQQTPNLDWGGSFSAALRPLQFGALRILPTASSELPTPDAALVVDAHDAFGSGLHATTALILERLSELELTGSVLDVGTGSGILALAALRLGCTRAVGVDTDPQALIRAEANAERNGLASRLELRAGLPDASERFPLIVANILPAVLIGLADGLVRRLGASGILLLSGLQANDVEEVWRAYRHLGCRKLLEDRSQDWVRLELLAPW